MRWVSLLLAVSAVLSVSVSAQSPLPRRPLFGVAIATLSDSARAASGLPDGTRGVVVQSVTAGTTADAMGIAVGDVLVELNGTPTPATAELLAVLRGLKTGAPIEACGFRAGAPITKRGRLLGRPLERTGAWETIAAEVTVAQRRRRVLITRPLRDGPHPMLFVIGGIGPYTMDGPIATIPYAPIFRRFADAGWVTVRVDKPGQGDSEGGDISELVFDDELAGYREALRFMLRAPYVDTSRVVLFGHSMGGSHSAVLANEFPQIKGVAASATIGTTFIEYWFATLRRQFALSHVPAGDADRIMRAMSQLMPVVLEGGQSPRDVARTRPELAEAAMLAFGADGNTLSGMSVLFWRQLNAHNMGAYWSRTNAKVLALAGESDFVATREDLMRIADIVNASHPGNGRFALLPATDHFLQRRATYAESFAGMGKAPAEANNAIVDTLVAWAAPWWPGARPEAAPAPPPAAVLFEGVHVVSMERDGIDRDRSVLVRDGRIDAIAARDRLTVPAGATRIDARGKYLIPGLYDMHAHLVPGTGNDMDPVQRQLTVYVALGVTTVRALSAPPTAFDVRRRANTGELLAPSLFVTGESINGQSAPTVDAVNALVDKLAGQGADVLKTHGMWSSREPYAALVAAAKRHRLPLAGHVTPEFGLAGAVSAGQQIEHLDGMIAATVPDGTPLPPGQLIFDEAALSMVDSAKVDSVARVMAQRGIHHGPTLALFNVLSGQETANALRQRPDTMFTPTQALAQWRLQIENLSQQPVSPATKARFRAVRDLMVRRLQAHGVPLLAGSDSPQFFMVPGFGLHRELEALVQAGLSPYEALTAATRTPAAYLGRGAQSGTITVGKQADLVLLDADPLGDIRHTRRIQGVMLRGRWLDRTQLDALEGAVRTAVYAR